LGSKEKERLVSLHLFEKRLDEKFKNLKNELVRDYNELIEESNLYFDQPESNTQRSDLFRLS